MTTAVSIVVFHPDEASLKHIIRCSFFSDFVIVVDNTPGADLTRNFEGVSNLRYIPIGRNVGVAAALNVAAEMAIQNRNDWMLMLDQDSRLSRETHLLVSEYAGSVEDKSIALVSAIPVSRAADLKRIDAASVVRDVDHVITSGSSLNLSAYVRCGRFEEKLFIDHIDTEYCFRLRRSGFRVVELTRAHLEHALGEIVHKKLFGYEVQYVSHMPFRSYYYVRNGLYVAFKFFTFHPLFFMFFAFRILNDFGKAVLFQSQKALRLRMMILGAFHFAVNSYGQLKTG